MAYRLSHRGMVLYIFGMYPGEQLSIKDIQGKILKHFECTLDRRTIVKAIDEGDIVTGNITQSSERRGSFNLPTQVFTIHYKNEEK